MQLIKSISPYNFMKPINGERKSFQQMVLRKLDIQMQKKIKLDSYHGQKSSQKCIEDLNISFKNYKSLA